MTCDLRPVKSETSIRELRLAIRMKINQPVFTSAKVTIEIPQQSQ